MQSVVYVQICRDRNVPRPKRSRPKQLRPKSPILAGATSIGRLRKPHDQQQISDSSAGSVPTWDKARSVMKSRHLVLGRHLGGFLMGLVQGRIKGGNGGNCPGPSAPRELPVMTFVCFK